MDKSLYESIFKNEHTADNIDDLNKHISMENNTILCINIRSLNKHYNKLIVFLNSLEKKPDVIVCTESWNLIKHNMFKIPEYRIHYNESRINKADGVVVYIKEEITESTEITEIGNLKIINSKIELENNRVLIISAIYRSHGLPKTEFLLHLKELLKLNKNYKNNVIIGDFNFDILSEDVLDQDFLQVMLENGYCPGLHNITRPSNIDVNKGSCIDNFFIKLDKIKYNTYVLKIPFNDHHPIMMGLKNNYKIIDKPNYKKINYYKLKDIASKTIWSDIYKIDDPNIALNNLVEKIQSCIKTATNLNNKHKNDKMKPRSKWITKAIMSSCIHKEKLYNIWKKDPTNTTKRDNYRKYLKILEKTIELAKEKHEKYEIAKNQHSPRNLWRIIDNKIGKKTRNINNIKYLKVGNNKVTEANEIAEHMNSFFSNIGQQLSNTIRQPQNTNIPLPPMNNSSIFLQSTNRIEIRKIILQMGNKNGGADGINTQVLKTIINNIIDPMAYIFNMCLHKEIWPDELKSAEIIPIHKAKEKYLSTNYRPISLISNIAKIFEKLLHVRITNFFNKHNLFSNKQFGFRKGLSTKDALYNITNSIYEQLDKSKPIAVTFLDLAKAFDTVNHKILLKKLYRYGIRGSAYELIKSYLSNRKQRVKTNGVHSQYQQVNTGVPQGTILGPLLFIIYINDMLELLPNDIISAFADDTAIIVKGEKWSEVETSMNYYLNKISTWLALNRLSLNIDKTVYIAFGNNCTSNATQLNINIQGTPIQKVHSTKYLGVFFDSYMRWDQHTNIIYNKLKYLTYIFYKLAKIMSIANLRMVYYALFHSILTYGIVAWGGAYTGRTKYLQSLQTKILQIINKNIFIQEKNPLNIDQTFTLESLIYHYQDFQDKIMKKKSITRKKTIQHPKRKRTVSIKNSYIRALYTFNKLPINLKTLEDKEKTIKNKIKEWIQKNP